MFGAIARPPFHCGEAKAAPANGRAAVYPTTPRGAIESLVSALAGRALPFAAGVPTEARDNPAVQTGTETGLAFELILRVKDEDDVQTDVSLGELCQGEVSDVALLGLSLSESKRVLTRVQSEIVTRQFESMVHERRACACCLATPSIKDYQPIRFRSLFGDVDLRVPRYAKCGCAAAGTGPRTPQRRWISAELECVQSELAASLSYQRCAQVLRRLLPIGRGHSASTVRARTLRVGRRLDAELTASVAPSPHPSSVTAVGLDGGYVRHSAAEGGQSFEIIAGRVLAKGGLQRSVAFVRSVDKNSRTRVQHAVTALGGADDGLRVFTDGDGTLRDLQLSVLPEATHVLDWYHLTRKLTVLASVIDGKEAARELCAARPGSAVRMDGVREVAAVARSRGQSHYAAAVDAEPDGMPHHQKQGGGQTHVQAGHRTAWLPEEQCRLDSRLWSTPPGRRAHRDLVRRVRG
jgi:hypothetical protein